MNCKKKMKSAVISSFIGILIYGLVLTNIQAHTLWINATDFTPELGEKSKNTVIFLGWGHDFPVQDFLMTSDMQDYYFLTPEGKKRYDKNRRFFINSVFFI